MNKLDFGGKKREERNPKLSEAAMGIQHEFYRHITDGDPGEATQLLALMALHLAHDSAAYPMSLAEVASIGSCRRDPRPSCLNQLIATDFVREALFCKLRPWLPPEVEQLVLMLEHGGYQYGDALRLKPADDQIATQTSTL